MEPAPELVDFFERLLTVSMTLKSELFMEAWSRHAGSLFIGPDPNEWWEGFDQIAAIGAAQFHEMRDLGGITFQSDEVRAWKEGTVGWIAAKLRVSLGEFENQDARMTVIVHETGAFWKVVHWHFAFLVTNEEALGAELTTAVDELLLLVQDQSPPPAGMAADGSVTIVFTDIEGSTELMESMGESKWLELLTWHESVVKQQTLIFGGTVVKNQGDGFMLAFPAAGSATACATAIQRSLSIGWQGVDLPVRVGLHTGNAKAEAGDFFGRTVVLAARVANSAGGGEILLSQSVHDELDGAFPLDNARTLALKGLSGEHAVYPLRWR
jgi:class 3 adenylate cyclase